MSMIGHNSRELSAEGLPQSLQDVAEICGASIVFALVDHFGGTEIKIPEKIKDGHFLEVLGRGNAELLCHFFPLRKFDLPKTLDRSKLKRQVDDLASKNWGRNKIARELGITSRHVRRLANSDPPEGGGVCFDDRQLDLFSGMDD